jgi:hypothetical protein
MIKNTSKQINDLLARKTEVRDFSIDGIKLGNTPDQIPLTEIVEMSLSSQVDGKFIENSSDYTFKERLKMLDQYNSFVHLAGGLGIHIQNQKIDQIRISKRYLDPFVSMDKNQIEKIFGKPDYELIDDTMMGVTIYDYNIDSYISVYGKLYLFFEPVNFQLKGITLGDLDEKYYTRNTANTR